MDEGYSYGYNSTRDASTLTPRKPDKPDDAGSGVRGGEGKPKGGDHEGGCRESLASTEEEVTPANKVNNFAASILSRPTEGELDRPSDGGSLDATVRGSGDPHAASSSERASEDDRDECAQSMNAKSVTPQPDHRDRVTACPSTNDPRICRSGRHATPSPTTSTTA